MVRISLITIGDRAYPFQSVIVGSSGDLGGIIFATIFWFQFNTLGKPFWFCGIICVVYIDDAYCGFAYLRRNLNCLGRGPCTQMVKLFRPGLGLVDFNVEPSISFGDLKTRFLSRNDAGGFIDRDKD